MLVFVKHIFQINYYYYFVRAQRATIFELADGCADLAECWRVHQNIVTICDAFNKTEVSEIA